MKKQWPVNVLKVEERFLNIFDPLTKSSHPESAGWWAVLETNPHISIYLGETRPDIGSTLILTLETPQ